MRSMLRHDASDLSLWGGEYALRTSQPHLSQRERSTRNAQHERRVRGYVARASHAAWALSFISL